MTRSSAYVRRGGSTTTSVKAGAGSVGASAARRSSFWRQYENVARLIPSRLQKARCERPDSRQAWGRWERFAIPAKLRATGPACLDVVGLGLTPLRLSDVADPERPKVAAVRAREVGRVDE